MYSEQMYLLVCFYEKEGFTLIERDFNGDES